jgi:parvulin-like peptidyl-prolyl isomerase
LNNGEDFAALAAELSTDTSNKDNGGDLSWFGKNVMDPAFEEAAYALNIGEISNPVQSQFGYHLIQLLGKEVRPLSSSKIQQLEQTAFSEWLTAQKEALNIEKFDSVWQKIVPTVPAFMEQSAQ